MMETKQTATVEVEVSLWQKDVLKYMPKDKFEESVKSYECDEDGGWLFCKTDIRRKHINSDLHVGPLTEIIIITNNSYAKAKDT